MIILLLFLLSATAEFDTISNFAEKATVVTLLVFMVIYLIRDRIALVNELKSERLSRINDLRTYSEDVSSLLEKVLSNMNNNSAKWKEDLNSQEDKILSKVEKMGENLLKRVDDNNKSN